MKLVKNKYSILGLSIMLPWLCLTETLADIPLAWDDPNPPGTIASYNLYGGPTLTNMVVLLTTTNKFATVTQMIQGNYFFQVSAVATVTGGSLESAKSASLQLYAPFTLTLRLAVIGTNTVVVGP
jgi:hypothetical protein